jgi:ribonuclease HII
MQKKMNSAIKSASLRHEHHFQKLGYDKIFGMDEAGRGTWAGPVTVGTVCLPLSDVKLKTMLAGVRDSKEMTPRQRTQLAGRIQEVAAAWGVGSASNQEIDECGIDGATRLAMERALAMALKGRDYQPDCLFLDSILWPEMKHIAQVSMIDGDKRSLSIAAASVIAKVWRDDLMRELDKEYPQYEFAVHKGYGTAKHRALLKAYGPSPLHRMTFKPLLELRNSLP